MRGAGRLAVVTLEDQLLVMTRLRIRLGWLQQELAYIFGVSEAGVSLTFQEVDYFLVLEAGTTSAVAILGGCEGVHGSASVRTTLTHLLSWMPQSCAPKFVAVWPCSRSFILLIDDFKVALSWENIGRADCLVGRKRTRGPQANTLCMVFDQDATIFFLLFLFFSLWSRKLNFRYAHRYFSRYLQHAGTIEGTFPPWILTG